MSNLNVIDSSTKLFSLDKPKIIIKINPNNNSISNNNLNVSNLSHHPIKLGQTTIIVSNITSEYLAIKLKTTKKSYYSINPSYFVLLPNAQQKLELNYYVNVGEKVSNVGHKFKFEGFVIKPEEKNEDSKSLFNTYIKNQTPVKASFIKTSIEFIENELNLNLNQTNEININEKSSSELYSLNVNNTNLNNNENNNINNNTNTEIKEKINEQENNDNNNIINEKEENIILEEKEQEKENNININDINENNIEDEINNNNTLAKQSNKTLPIDTNNNLLNNNELKEKNMIFTYGKNKFDKYSNNDFGTPKKKRLTNANIKNEEFEMPKTEEEKNALLNKLKVEYYKLKNELDNLIERYYNLKNHVDLEEDNKDLISEENNNIKNKYSERKKKEIKLPQNISIILFILAVLLGFYLS